MRTDAIFLPGDFTVKLYLILELIYIFILCLWIIYITIIVLNYWM